MLTAGPANRWIHDDHWHDVSCLGPEPFGLGVLARQVPGGLYYMDSVRRDEQEWIYAEPFGWKDPVEIDRDFDVAWTVVPHATGKGRYAATASTSRGRCWRPFAGAFASSTTAT